MLKRYSLGLMRFVTVPSGWDFVVFRKVLYSVDRSAGKLVPVRGMAS